MQIGMSLYKCHLSLWQVWAVVLLMLSLQVLNGRGSVVPTNNGKQQRR